MLTYIPSYWGAVQGAKITLETDKSWKATILANGLPATCALIDSGAFYIIDLVFTNERFYKNHQRLGLKFVALNAYTVSSNLIYQILGFIKGSDEVLTKRSPDQKKYKIAKSVIDSTTMSIFSIIIAAIISQMLIPIIKFHLQKNFKPETHDITFGFSNANILLFNLGFYAPIDPNAIFTVIICLGIFYYLEGYMLRKGVI